MVRPKDDFNFKNGACVLCNKARTDKGHDPCIGDLPGVIFACCGHGNEDGYIKFVDGRVLTFRPLEVDLTEPQHELVDHDNGRRIPVFVRGETRRILEFKRRRVREQDGGMALSRRSKKNVTIEQRSG